MNDLKTAFAIGRAFGEGFLYGCRLALASDAEEDDVTFRTAKNGSIIAIKDGEVAGGAGTSVGPDKLPAFSSFASDDKFKGKSFSYKVRCYAKEHLRPVIESLRYPGGMPLDCERITMSNKQIGELVSHMDTDKAAILPFLAQVYREGKYRTGKDWKHPDAFDNVVYTTGIVKIGGRRYEVEVLSKRRIGQTSGRPEYVQYGISKADSVSQDSLKDSAIYELLDVNVREK